MAATFVWAARGGVRGLHRLENSWRDRQTKTAVGLTKLITMPTMVTIPVQL
jgi:hypothetical protein